MPPVVNRGRMALSQALSLLDTALTLLSMHGLVVVLRLYCLSVIRDAKSERLARTDKAVVVFTRDDLAFRRFMWPQRNGIAGTLHPVSLT